MLSCTWWYKNFNYKEINGGKIYLYLGDYANIYGGMSILIGIIILLNIKKYKIKPSLINLNIEYVQQMTDIIYWANYYSKNTKLIHFGFREYDPFIGRWTAKDPDTICWWR